MSKPSSAPSTIHKQQYVDPDNVYVDTIAKYLSPWIRTPSKLNGPHIHTDQPFSVFSSAHLLELKLLSSGVFAHYRITRYIHQTTETGIRKWILRPGKPSLQFVPMPCHGLTLHGITPNYLKDNNKKPFMRRRSWDVLQYVINISRDSDLPDHVDLLFFLDDRPLLDQDRIYHFLPLRTLVSKMREISITPPVLSYCSQKNKLSVPFLYAGQLLMRPIETLVNKLLTFRNRSSNELTQTLLEFKRRNDTAFWRGSTTGQHYTLSNWNMSQRSRLVQLSTIAPHLLDARFTRCAQCASGVAQLMNRSFGQWWGAKMEDSDTYFKSKFLVDIDGNSWSSRFYELMLTGALVFKVNSTNQCNEFWYDLLRPGVDFVPIAEDMHDLFSKLIYFREHPEKALQIVNNGMKRVSFLLHADIWPRYVTGILRAVASLQTKPDSPEEQTITSLNLTSDGCSFMSFAWCACKPNE